MHFNSDEINIFYSNSELGAIVRRLVNNSLASIKKQMVRKNHEEELLVGYGYCSPYLNTLSNNLTNSMLLIPEKQGLISQDKTPSHLTALVEESEWPLDSETVDIALLSHGLETCENPRGLIEEAWRVLMPEKYLIVVAPNRSGFWSRSDITPFGHGRPYSLSQLSQLLGENKFEIGATKGALFAPPFNKKIFLKGSYVTEKLACKLGAKVMSGLIVMLAQKKIYIPPSSKIRESIKVPLGIIDDLMKPKPKPVRRK